MSRLAREKCRKIWRNFFRKRKVRVVVDKAILPDERCVRCVVHPFHVKKGHKLRPEAFLPRSASDGVSLLRLRYCNESFAFRHGLGLVRDGARLDGLAIITQNLVSEVNSWAQGEASKQEGCWRTNGLSAEIKYAPMKNDHEYASLSDDVFLDDPNVLLPMHAELTFSGELEEDEIRTRMRQYSRELAKRAQSAFVPY